MARCFFQDGPSGLKSCFAVERVEGALSQLPFSALETQRTTEPWRYFLDHTYRRGFASHSFSPYLLQKFHSDSRAQPALHTLWLDTQSTEPSTSQHYVRYDLSSILTGLPPIDLSSCTGDSGYCDQSLICYNDYNENPEKAAQYEYMVPGTVAPLEPPFALAWGAEFPSL